MRLPCGERDGSPAQGTAERRSVTADVVVLGAGALGSTEILLRSKAHGLPLSDRLGQRFSGNGDVLALGYNSYWQSETDAGGQAVQRNINGVGTGRNDVAPANLPGPCITGVIDMRQTPEVGDGLVIEEGVIPGALAPMLTPALFFADAMLGGEFAYGASQAKPRLLDAQVLGEAVQNDPGSLTGLAYSGAVARTQTYLVMSVDDAAGRLHLENDRLRIDWPKAGDSATIAKDEAWLRAANDAIQGQFVAESAVDRLARPQADHRAPAGRLRHGRQCARGRGQPPGPGVLGHRRRRGARRPVRLRRRGAAGRGGRESAPDHHRAGRARLPEPVRRAGLDDRDRAGAARDPAGPPCTGAARRGLLRVCWSG